MSVNTIAGLPVLEVFANNTVVMGTFGQNTLVVSGSNLFANQLPSTSDTVVVTYNTSTKRLGYNTVAGPTGPQGPAGLLASGSAAGNTPYWDGTQWVLNSSNIFNNGSSIGIGTVAPNSSAALEVNSTTKGFLLPTMTQTQRNAISTPATGLLIYQSDNTPGFYYYNGSAWSAIVGAGGGGATGYSSTANTLIYTTDGF